MQAGCFSKHMLQFKLLDWRGANTGIGVAMLKYFVLMVLKCMTQKYANSSN